MDKPKQIDTITYQPEFSDCWGIRIYYDDYDCETLTCSDNPSHPQGVFSSNDGNYLDDMNSDEKQWEDLPETLQKFLINYIATSLDYIEQKN